ncbi:MAG: Fur family transcriptional regulator [Acidimicrobiales bacterium]
MRPGSKTPPTEPLSSADEVLAELRARGGRVTTCRRVMLEVLFDAPGSMTAEDVAAAVQLRAPEVHLSTIYRNLEDFEEHGVVSHTHLGHGPATYQLVVRAHAHFVCESCGVAINAPEAMFGGLARRAKDELGFSIDPRHFAIPGRCTRCSC